MKILGDRPLIDYSIDFARNFTSDTNICVSSDDNDLIDHVNYNYFQIEFKRPENLSTDHSTTSDVIIHAINYYETLGRYYDLAVLLQPTSPFRDVEDFNLMLSEWTEDLDLLVSVKESHDSPYFNIFEEDSNGFLEKSKEIGITRRQDGPKVYAFNGSIYIYKVSSLVGRRIKRIKKYLMKDPICSIDIDTSFDFMQCETVITNKLF